eukprot:324652-Pyramimonas_sp.AAC.1
MALPAYIWPGAWLCASGDGTVCTVSRVVDVKVAYVVVGCLRPGGPPPRGSLPSRACLGMGVDCRHPRRGHCCLGSLVC